MNNELQISDSDVRNIAYAYNLCVVFLSQIVDYNDIYYALQVRDEIFNNLNLENFPKDSALCDALESLVVTIGHMEMNELNRNRIEEKYKNEQKNALWNAVPSISVIVTGGNPASAAINALLSVGTAIMNYKKSLNDIKSKKSDEIFKLEEAQKKAIKGLRLRLFGTAWDIMKSHPIPDEMRLSENDIKEYNDALNDTTLKRRYSNLWDIKDRFEAFPPFWYNLGETAREIYCENNDPTYKEKALRAYEKFRSIHFDYLRQDIFAASCCLSHISLLDFKNDKDLISELLKDAIRYSRSNCDLIQQCLYTALMINDIDTARELLKRLCNKKYQTEINGKILSLIYNRYDNDKKAYDELFEILDNKDHILKWIDVKPELQLENFFDNMSDNNYTFLLGSDLT